jgi:hypothetical protein
MCTICEHPKRQVIDAVIMAGLAPSVVAAKFHVAKKLVELHADHMTPRNGVNGGKSSPSSPKKPVGLHADHMTPRKQSDRAFPKATVPYEALQASCDDTPAPETAMEALRLALPYLRQASRLIRSDNDYDVIVAEINEALCSNRSLRRGRAPHDTLEFP